jgi:hypothetical protein
MSMPGFTAEASVYRTRNAYPVSRRGHHTDLTLHPVLKPEEPNPGELPTCTDKCTAECIQEKKCNTMTTVQKEKCKGDCWQKCEKGCKKYLQIGWGPPIEKDCDFLSNRWISCAGITLWEEACLQLGGGVGCFAAAAKARDDSDCHLCD